MTRYFSAPTGSWIQFYFDTSAGDDAYFEIDELSIKAVSGNSGLMTNMTASDIVTDVPS